jgi:hypothetical protein
MKAITRKATLTLIAILFVGCAMFVVAPPAEACACGAPLTEEGKVYYANLTAKNHNALPMQYRYQRATTINPPPGYYYGYAYFLVPIVY